MISELRQKYPLKDLLSIAGVPRSTYYYYLKRMQQPDKYRVEKEEIIAIYHENQGRYGYRRITLEMHNRGYHINHKTVSRLMKVLGLKCQVRIKKYRSYKGEIGKIAPNLINRDFHAEAPNQKWTTDVTEFALFGRKLYLSPILDMYNGEIVSYEGYVYSFFGASYVLESAGAATTVAGCQAESSRRTSLQSGISRRAS